MSLRTILKVRKKGILILPKKLREACNIKEDSEVIAEVRGNMLVIRPLKPPLIVGIDAETVEKILREEKILEDVKYEEIIKKETIDLCLI